MPISAVDIGELYLFAGIRALLVAMFILSSTATAASHISYSAALTMSIILTAVGVIGAAVSTVSACRYIKKNWQF